MPLLWRIWVQDKEKCANARLTKLELAKDMLLSLREVTSVRLWIAMDRWFLCKELFQWLNSKNFDLVTKCKRNTALYQLSGTDWKGNPRYSPVKPGQLLALNYSQLVKSGNASQCSALNIPDIYIKLQVMKPNKQGKMVKSKSTQKLQLFIAS